MKPKYSNDYSSANVLPSKAMPEVMEISSFFTRPAERSQGHGTELIQSICADADIERKVLLIVPKAHGKGPKSLEAFYGRFGFIQIQKSPSLMARMPHIFKVQMNPITQAVKVATHG